MRSEKPCLRKVNVTKTKFTIDTHNLDMLIFFLMALLSILAVLKILKKILCYLKIPRIVKLRIFFINMLCNFLPPHTYI